MPPGISTLSYGTVVKSLSSALAAEPYLLVRRARWMAEPGWELTCGPSWLQLHTGDHVKIWGWGRLPSGLHGYSDGEGETVVAACAVVG
jgi:hypothetical protein